MPNSLLWSLWTQIRARIRFDPKIIRKRRLLSVVKRNPSAGNPTLLAVAVTVRRLLHELAEIIFRQPTITQG